MAGSSEATGAVGSIVGRELKEYLEVRHTIGAAPDGLEGKQTLDLMGFVITMTWNRYASDIHHRRFTLNVTDKYHPDKGYGKFHIIFTTTTDPAGYVRTDERVCTTGIFDQEFTRLHPEAPCRVLLQIDRTRQLPREGLHIDDKSFQRYKKIVKDLYENLDSTGDVTITTANRTDFRVHRVVLENQSPVFKAMFDTDMKERKESKIKMEAIEDDLVAADFIEFLYFGWNDNLQTNIKELAKLANLYLVHDLIEACWVRLVKGIKIENCIELLILADQYGDPEGVYKKRVGRCVVANYRDIRGTDQYAELVRNHSELYLEICREED